MFGRRRLMLAIPVLCILGACLIHPRLPAHKGKTLAEWFDEPDLRDRNATRDTAGIEAVLEMRGEAVPFLTRAARKGPNWWSRRYVIVYSALPAGVQGV